MEAFIKENKFVHKTETQRLKPRLSCLPFVNVQKNVHTRVLFFFFLKECNFSNDTKQVTVGQN